MRTNSLLWFLVSVAILAVVGVAAFLFGLRWLGREVDAPVRRWDYMVSVLKQTVEPDALREAASVSARKYTDGRPHKIEADEQPEAVRKVMKAFGFAEAIVANDPTRNQVVLCLATPGGFGSSGVYVIPSGSSFTPPTNKAGVTVRQWTNGVYVFYSN